MHRTVAPKTATVVVAVLLVIAGIDFAMWWKTWPKAPPIADWPNLQSGRGESNISQTLSKVVAAPQERTVTSLDPALVDAVKAALPKELLVEAKADAQAQGRFNRLITLLQTLDKGWLINIYSNKDPASERYTAANALWDSTLDLCPHVDTIVESGPFQSPQPKLGNLENASSSSLIQIMDFFKAATESAILYAAHGEFHRCAHILSMSSKLGDRILASGGSDTVYRLALMDEGMVNHAIGKSVSNPRFPAADCKRLLDCLSAAPYPDEYLAPAIRTGFQTSDFRYLLELIQDKNKVDNKNDWIAAVRQFGAAAVTWVANSRKPYSKMDRSADHPIETHANDKAQKIDEASRAFGAMRELTIEASCNYRAMREATRVLLASKLYRLQHGGKLPATKAGFFPYLGAWPKDPFNGKPMIYSAQKKVIYSVGQHLKDGGGKINSVPTKSVGLWLK